MKYSIIKLDEYDKSFKIEKRKILCYSPKEFKKLPDDVEIVGEINKYDEDEKAETVLVVGDKSYPVEKPDSTSHILYSCKGYVAVGDKEYIALFKSRLPFIFWLLGIILIAVLGIILIFSIDTTPKSDTEVFNPLPPVDSNVEELNDGKEASDDITGGEVNLDYSTTVTLNLSTKNIDIDFSNPGNSSHEVVLELYVISTEGKAEKEYLIARSGRIPAGNKLSTLEFTENPQLFQGEGKYKARYHAKFYNPETGEKSILDSSLDNITLIVKK